MGKYMLGAALLLLPAIAAAQTPPAQTSTDAAATAKPKSANDPSRVICRSYQESGSLVRRTKRCMTSAEWAQTRRVENEAARDYVRDNGTGQ